MARLPVETVVKRYKKAVTDRDLNRGLFEDVYDLILPYRNTFSQKGRSFNRPNKQFDSTAMIAQTNFVNTMQSSFTPHFSRWAELKAGPGTPLENRQELDEQLEALTEKLFAFIHASNFSTASAEMYTDLNVGTGVMFILEGDESRPLNFVAVPLSEIALEEGIFGTIEGIYRTHKVRGRNVKNVWKKAIIPEDLGQMIRKPDEEIIFWEAVYWDAENLVWYYDIIHEKSKKRIVEQEFKEDFILTPRWMKVPGIAYGIGPALLALPDIKTINKFKELILKNAALNIFGTYTVTNDGVVNPNTAMIRPAGFLPVARNAGTNGPSIAALPRSGNFEMQQFMVEDLKQQIKEIMMDRKLPPDAGPVKSATEIMQRIKDLQSNIGAAYGRLIFEFVLPMFRRCIAILARKGKIEIPKGLEPRLIDNFFIKVQVLSAVAKTQSTEDVQKLVQTLQIVQSIDPTLIQSSFKVGEIPQWVSDNLGSPAKLLMDEDERIEKEKEIEEAKREQGQLPGGPRAQAEQAQADILAGQS